MEGSKQVGSSSSLTSELFGSKDSHPSSSSGTLGSLFSPSSKVKTASEAWSSKIGTPDGGNNDGAQSTGNKDMSSIYEEQRVQPCHLSSSIYYGGQDIYAHPQSTKNAGLNSLYKKDGGEDDSGTASRGDWWLGLTKIYLGLESLYY